jgi:F-type H+-transporting ATPase subunit delta
VEEIATVYARSLFDVAREQDKLDVVLEQLDEFTTALQSDQQLQVFFFSPYFSSQEKIEGLQRVLDGADETFLNFLAVVIEKHRMPALFRIRRAFQDLWQEHNKLLPVNVTSAVQLDQGTVDQIGERISQQTGRKVELSADVQPHILGGIVVRVGNQVLDASVRNRLERLRKQVARAA